MNSMRKGDIAELAIAADLTKKGYQVAFPFSTSCDYDLVLDRNGFNRVQVKYATIKNGVIPVRNRTHSNTSAKQTSRIYTKDDIDWLAVYCPDNDQCYYIHSIYLKGETLSLRVEPTKNKQENGVLWAENFKEI